MKGSDETDATRRVKWFANKGALHFINKKKRGTRRNGRDMVFHEMHGRLATVRVGSESQNARHGIIK